MRFPKEKLIPTIVAFASAAMGFIGVIALPDKIFVQIIDSSPNPETDTLLFTVIGIIVIGLAGMMSSINENGRKWLAIEAILSVAYIGCFIYNFIVI